MICGLVLGVRTLRRSLARVGADVPVVHALILCLRVALALLQQHVSSHQQALASTRHVRLHAVFEGLGAGVPVLVPHVRPAPGHDVLSPLGLTNSIAIAALWRIGISILAVFPLFLRLVLRRLVLAQQLFVPAPPTISRTPHLLRPASCAA